MLCSYDTYLFSSRGTTLRSLENAQLTACTRRLSRAFRLATTCAGFWPAGVSLERAPLALDEPAFWWPPPVDVDADEGPGDELVVLHTIVFWLSESDSQSSLLLWANASVKQEKHEKQLDEILRMNDNNLFY